MVFVTRSDDLHSIIFWKILGVYHALAFVLAVVQCDNGFYILHRLARC
jgi:hypothetical protein